VEVVDGLPSLRRSFSRLANIGTLGRSSHHHEQGAETDCCHERGSRGIDLVVATEICKVTPWLAARAIILKANHLAMAHTILVRLGFQWRRGLVRCLCDRASTGLGRRLRSRTSR
jgi:hypothetical protein